MEEIDNIFKNFEWEEDDNNFHIGDKVKIRDVDCCYNIVKNCIGKTSNRDNIFIIRDIKYIDNRLLFKGISPLVGESLLPFDDDWWYILDCFVKL